MAPWAAVRVGLVGDDFIINPTYQEIEEGDLDLVVAGSPDGVIMVEAGANKLPEQDVIEAIDFGYEVVRDLIQAQLDLVKELGLERPTEPAPEESEDLANFLADKATTAIKEVLKQFDQSKSERDGKLDTIKAAMAEEIQALDESDAVRTAVDSDKKSLGQSVQKLN